MKISLTLNKVFANGTGRVKTNTIVLFRFGPILLGSMKLTGQWEDDSSTLGEVAKGMKVKYTEAGEPLKYVLHPSYLEKQ